MQLTGYLELSVGLGVEGVLLRVVGFESDVFVMFGGVGLVSGRDGGRLATGAGLGLGLLELFEVGSGRTVDPANQVRLHSILTF